MSALDSGAKSFFSTLKEVGTDKAISEALIGGGVGIGGNMAYNVATGDSGGYTGAALLGGAAGGLGRAGLKHFNLETQASNLFSTMKSGSVGAMTQAQKTIGTKSNKPAGQILRDGSNERSIDDYIKREAELNRQASKLSSKGYDSQADEILAEADAVGIRRKEKQSNQFRQLSKNKTPGELEDMYSSQGGASYIKDNLDPNFRSVEDRLNGNKKVLQDYKEKGLANVRNMGRSDTPLLGYSPGGSQGQTIPLPYGPIRTSGDIKDVTNNSKFQNGYNLSRSQNQSERSILKNEDRSTGQFSFALGATGKNKNPIIPSSSSAQKTPDFDFSNQGVFDFDAPVTSSNRIVTGADMKRNKKKNRRRNK